MKKNQNIVNLLLSLLFFCVLTNGVHAGLLKSFSKSTQSVGHYWNGSLKNGKALKDKGTGYQVVRVSRDRYYGNEELVDFIERLGKKTAKNDFGILLIGDMAKKTGGRIPGTHRSHQTGLDADIFFNLEPDYLGSLEREQRGPQSILRGGRVDPKKWTRAHSEILKAASNDEHVERIFVNHAIKKHLCKLHPKESWLTKIRPMGGHTGHFHVRLGCPKNSPACKAQPKPVGNQC